jgi:hypothetical protein
VFINNNVNPTIYFFSYFFYMHTYTHKTTQCYSVFLKIHIFTCNHSFLSRIAIYQLPCQDVNNNNFHFFRLSMHVHSASNFGVVVTFLRIAYLEFVYSLSFFGVMVILPSDVTVTFLGMHVSAKCTSSPTFPVFTSIAYSRLPDTPEPQIE